MNLGSMALWGFIATLVMSVMMAGGQHLGFSRMSLPFLLGTTFTANRDRALALGTALHLLNGWIFAFLYALSFEAWGSSSWWGGALAGALHGLVVLLVLLPLMPGVHPRMASESQGPRPTRALEPPGFLGLNYGRSTAAIAFTAHLAYGLILGAGYQVQ